MWALISDYIGTILNVVSVLIFSAIILKQKSNVTFGKLTIFVLAMAAILQIFCYFNVTIFKTFIMFFLFAVLIKTVYSVDVSEAIILDFFYYISIILADIICINVLTLIIGEETFYSVIAGSFLGNIVVLFPLTLVAFIFRGLIYKALNIKIKYKLLFTMLISTLCILVIFYATFKLGTNSADKLLCIFCMLVFILVLSNTFIQVYKNSQLTTEYDNLLTFIKKYEAEIDKQRTLRHETKNQFLIIKSKIIDKENDSAIIDYIDELLNDGRKVKHSEYAKLKYLPSNGIRGLFYFKLALAQDKGININVTISDKMENSFLKDMDASNFNQIGKILGVYLDNAIESADLTKEKTIEVEVYEEEDAAVFIISNSYNPSIKKIGRSSKGVGHGYGLLLAKSIIKNNKKLVAETQASEDHYIKKLTIKK